MNANRRVYVDMDDVLCETARRLTALASELFGLRVEFDDIHSFDLAESFRLEPDQYKVLMEAAHSDDVLLSIETVPGAAAVLRQCAQAGLSICVVTGRPVDGATVSRTWLKQHKIPFDELIFVDKYGRHDREGADRGSIELEELVRQTFCLAVEDEPKTAAFLAGKLNAPVVLLSRPWNAGSRFEGLIRCDGWGRVGEWLVENGLLPAKEG